MKKDWTGTQASIFKAIAATNHTDARRVTDDFYATHPSAIDALLDYPHLTLPHHIWEPSCGAGHLSRRLVERGFDVTSTDLIDRGYGTGGQISSYNVRCHRLTSPASSPIHPTSTPPNMPSMR